MSGSDEFGKVAAAAGRWAGDIGKNGVTLQLKSEQIGYAAAAFVTLLGVSVIGPSIARVLHPKRPSLKKRSQRLAKGLRDQAELAGYRGRKRMRSLGDQVRS